MIVRRVSEEHARDAICSLRQSEFCMSYYVAIFEIKIILWEICGMTFVQNEKNLVFELIADIVLFVSDNNL